MCIKLIFKLHNFFKQTDIFNLIKSKEDIKFYMTRGSLKCLHKDLIMQNIRKIVMADARKHFEKKLSQHLIFPYCQSAKNIVYINLKCFTNFNLCVLSANL